MVYVRSNETYEVNGPDSCPETPIMGGVSVQKYDKSRLNETNDYAQAKVGPGGIKLSNAEITIINRSEKAIVFEGRSIPPYSGDFDPANATSMVLAFFVLRLLKLSESAVRNDIDALPIFL